VSPPVFCAVVPAAGSATRMGTGPPKPLRSLAGATVMEWALSPLLARRELTHLVVTVPPDDDGTAAAFTRMDARIEAVAGGASRAASVANGLAALAEDDPAAPVLVHDAARPCLPAGDLERLLAIAGEPDGGLLAVPVSDTLKRGDDQHRVAATVERSGLWRALTPQGFPRARLSEALARADDSVTDDASAIEAIGGAPHLVTGDPANIKITRPDDLALAEAILAGRRAEPAS